MSGAVKGATDGAKPIAASAPEWPQSLLCRRTRAPLLPPRLIASLLLAVLCARFVMQLVALHRSFPALSGGLWLRLVAALGAVGLGGCLWWVAKRQIGLAGAVVALLLYVTGPVTEFRPWTTMAALGLFGMTYTAAGVAHALQGPPRKWPPRIAMMACLTAFTAACETKAAIAALCLSLLAMVYVMEDKRRLLPGLFALWAVAALLGTGFAWLLGPHFALHWAPHVWVVEASGTRVSGLSGLLLPPSLLGVVVALLLSLVGWCAMRRSRYFGNSAPLLAAGLLLASWRWLGSSSILWALPFALLFIAGVAADALALSRRE
jgi:hypothetical protein